MHSPLFYYVYILTNRSKTLHVGVTSNLEERERFGDIASAIAREKQAEGLLRLKKIALIISMNP
jgi:predicted GIY-YIG superfamily endonuclease